MKFRALLAALLLPVFAQAQAPGTPTCWLVSGATGYTLGTNADGRFAGWWCAAEWSWTRVLLVAKSNYTLVHPATAASTSPVDTAVAYWNANVRRDCYQDTSDDLQLQRLCVAAYIATNSTRPPSRHIVSPYQNATYRATYSTSKAIDGVRSTASNGKVLITTAGQPTPVDCTLGRVVETGSTGAKTLYCSVNGVATTVVNSRLR